MRSSLASGKSATPPARCIHRPRRDTSSAEYRLLVSRASVGASRELSSRRSPALIPHTCAVSPTSRYGAFLFVASALADLSSARLASCDRGHASIRRKHRHYPTLIDPITTGRRLCGKFTAQAAPTEQCTLPLHSHYAIMSHMTFVCPYCRAETKAHFALSANFYGFGRTKCSTCGREFLCMPMAMKMEDKPAWEHFRSEAYSDHLMLVLIALLLGVAVFAIIFTIGYLIT